MKQATLFKIQDPNRDIPVPDYSHFKRGVCVKVKMGSFVYPGMIVKVCGPWIRRVVIDTGDHREIRPIDSCFLKLA